MKVEIPYGKELENIEFDLSYKILLPNEFEVQNEADILANALDNAIGMESFSEFVNKSDKLLVIVNDGTRPTPTRTVLEQIEGTLANHPDVKFIIATGAHRAPTDEEYKFIFGSLYEKFKDRIFAHDAHKDEDMVYLGKSKNGTEMYINKMAQEIGNIVIIGSVEPHYFAGYTGGRKSFLPGIASYKTITMNHKLALSDSARALALEGNPVHEDMVDAMNVLKDLNIFSIQTVLTGDHKIYAVTAGDLNLSFDAAISMANKIFCVELEKKGNIVISVAPYPMDIDLYQSQKALDNGKLALANGGILILVSKCRMGVGGDTFLKLMASADCAASVLEKIGEEYKLGYHKAAKMAQIGTWAKMWAVTDLPDETVRMAKIEPKETIQKALDEAISIVKAGGEEPRLVIMPAGSLTVPLVKEGA